ncbi:MAG: peptidylprolyl isomerase [Rhizobacter sp.]|nr:peptidylprolyl isomerase [Rhizobacter sp.]
MTELNLPHLHSLADAEGSPVSFLRHRMLGLCMALLASAGAAGAQERAAPRNGDYIAAIVNQELVTAGEVQMRLERVRDDAARSNARLPDEAALRKQVLDLLINERVQVTYARESGMRVDDAELDRAVANVALQNQLSLPQLRERLKQEGMDYGLFRTNLRDQMLSERVREREVISRIRISDADLDAFVAKRRAEAGASDEFNIAQILVTVPEGADAKLVAERRARAEAALARVRGGEAFAAVARELSEDGNRAQGGEIGLRPADRLPDVFMQVVRPMKAGEIAPTLLRTGAGFHILKLVAWRDGGALDILQTRVRHILLRPSAQLGQDAAMRRLSEFKRQILGGTATFEQLARENSEDGSAAQGGDLGWVSPGVLVPEFEDTMNAMKLNGISEPIVSRFGVHLIQVVERRTVKQEATQLREQARAALREQKFEQSYSEWLRELRARAYVELREAPL